MSWQARRCSARTERFQDVNERIFRATSFRHRTGALKVSSGRLSARYVLLPRPGVMSETQRLCRWIGYINEIRALRLKRCCCLTSEGEFLFCEELV